jgi:hypothetical protein
VNEVIVEKQLLAIYVPLNYLLESVYQIDCIKSKALFFIKFFKSLFQHLETGFFIYLIFGNLLLLYHSLKKCYIYINFLRT